LVSSTCELDLRDVAKKAESPNVILAEEIVRDAREKHREKAKLPTLVTLSGIDTADSDVQYWNALFPILATLFPSVTDVREEQRENA
jgi:hypothetical protein